MRYDLAKMAAQARPRRRGQDGRRTVTIPAVTLPLYMEDQLVVMEVRLLRALEASYRQLVLPQYTLPTADAQVADSVNGMQEGMAAAEAELRRLILVLTPALTDWAVRAETYHADQFARQVKTATGVDLATLVAVSDTAETMEGVVARLVNLVTGLGDDARKTLSETIWRGFTNRTPRSRMAREIRDTLLVSKRRADLIARDQTTKLAAVLDQERQTDLGIDRYRWRHSGKLRPRPEHVARNGQLFFWKKPPHDGHPGFAINCGCKAEAYIDLDD